MNIRPYIEADAAEVVALARELQAHEARLYDRMKPASDIGMWYLDLLRKQCREHEGVLLVAEIDGHCTGYATVLTRMSEDGTGDEIAYDYAYIGDLVVSAKWRGRGIGSRLIEECERRAKAAGRDELRISVIALNKDTHRLYHHRGFNDSLVEMRKKLP